jgi:hypothetical protein
VVKLKEITIDKLIFKNHLSMIEQYSLKDFMFKWLGSPEEGLDDLLPLTYTDQVFAKMETASETKIKITEDNQIVIGGLDPNQELKFRIVSLEERLKSY